MSTFGEISYDDSFGDKKGPNVKDLYLRLDDGENEVRLLTNPFQYTSHKIKKDPNNPKDFGQKAYCSKIHGECPACEYGDPKTRWLYGVISRKTGTYKVLDVPWSIFSQIKKLNNNPKWGDPTKYDICIIVDKNADPTSYYAVQPVPKEPLSATDQQIKDKDLDLEYLRQKVTPPQPADVQKRLNKILGDDSLLKNTAKPAAKNPPTAKVQVVTLDDDTDEKFPDYDSQ